MKIAGYVTGVLVVVLSTSSIGIIPALILGTLIGAAINMLFFGNQPSITPQALDSTSVATKSDSTHPSESQDAEMQFKIGQAYRLGAGVQKDLSKAFTLIQKSADQGYAEAQNMLGFMHQKGEGIPQNNAEAFNWYLLSAQQGNPKAQTNLGLMYADERNEFHDFVEAANLLLKAAEQGIDTAQQKMGELYYRGYGVQKDYREAAKWYGLAAKQGTSLEAEHMLNMMKLNGLI